ncbi:MAG: helicase-exonuclease AddAB subunit AddB [Clostridioides sp.]|nr:helicase-exonuclease AddAB subunit AddB [Clostridioides sp.]
MGFRFIFGRGGSGKSTFILDEVKKQVNNDEKTPIFILVPEQYNFEMEKRVGDLFLGGVSDKFLRVRILTFNTLSKIIFSNVGGLTDVNINSSGRAMIAYKSAQAVEGELSIFKNSIANPGFIEKISDTISELKQYNVSSEDMQLASGKVDSEALAMKLRDISAIYDSFEENLHEKYVDSQDILDSLSKKIGLSDYLDGATVYIDEFTGFTPKQYEIIRQLIVKAKDVNMSLTLDSVGDGVYSQTDVFSRTKFTYMNIMKILREEGVKISPPVNLGELEIPRFRGNKELIHLEKNYSFYPYEVYKGATEHVEIKIFNNLYEEIEEIAKEITRLVRDEGIRYKDITLATRDLNRYNFLVESIFTEYEIPYFLDAKRESKNNPIIVLIISALEMKSKNYRYDTMFRYLKSGLLGMDEDEISLLENYVLANGIRGNKWFEETWEYRINKDYSRDETQYELDVKARVNQIKDKVIRPISNLHDKLRGRNTAEGICRYVYEFLLDINLADTIELMISKFEGEGNLDRAKEYAQIWDIVIDMLDQMVEILGGEQIALKRFIDLMNLGFDENELGLVPPSLDQVLVSSVDRMKNPDTRYLYLIGTTDGVFPLITKDDGILNDEDRVKLEDSGIKIDIDSRTKTYEEQFLVYKSLTFTSENLIVSYPIADHEGKALRPSQIVSRIEKIFPNVKTTSYLISMQEEAKDNVNAKIPTFNSMVNALKEYDIGESKNGELDEIWLDVYRYFRRDENYKNITDKILSGLRYTNRIEKLEDKKIQELYHSNFLSVSRLEKYSECPFAYFIQYGLKAKERIEYAFTPPDLGTFVHNILEIFSKQLSQDRLTWGDIDEVYIESKVESIVGNLVEKIPGFILNSSQRYKYLAHRLRKLVTKSVSIIAYHIKQSSFEPTDYEVEFGTRGKYPPIKIVLDSGQEINLIGKIDRVDELNKDDEGYIRIIDYKSGEKDMNLTEVYMGLQLQLMVYLDAILESQNLKPAAIMYFKIDDPIVSFDEDRGEEEIQEAVLKKLKMKGLLVDDIDILKEMDKTLEPGVRSNIIPANLTSKGILGKNNSLVSYDDFEVIRKYVKKVAKEICEKMMDGNIDMEPYKSKKKSSCTFCNFSSICGFDTSLKENNYKGVHEKQNDEVILMMKGDIEK